MKIESIPAFPLQWPAGWKRTTYREKSRFNSNFGKARDEMVNQLKLMGAQNVVLSTNAPLRNDGLPYASPVNIKDPGVAVYFYYKKKQMVFACDKWNKIEDNLHAVNKTIEAVRGIERWGASEMMERAFTGFAQLEAPAYEWWRILGVEQNSSMEEIKSAYRKKCKDVHPDAGGSHELMAALNTAYEQAQKER